MPIHLKVDAPRRRVVATVSGELTTAEIIGTLSAAVNDPSYEPGFDVYSDHTGIIKAISSDQVKLMVEQLRLVFGVVAGTRWAIVTSSDASYGMMRMLSVHAEQVPMRVRVFRNADEAEEWLASPGARGHRSPPPGSR